MFKHLLDRLTEYVDSTGQPLLDNTIALWTNDLGNRNQFFNTILNAVGCRKDGGEIVSMRA